ncbi:MAG: DMT family transporter [Ruminococcaceae bacterium]|nr:DMT family transporter [Oscillospiraceae bacterium]
MKKGYLYSLLTAILFVTLEPVSKLIAGDISPFAITFWRFLIGSLILLPFAIQKIKKDRLRISGKDLLTCALLGVLFICVSMVSLQVAVKESANPSLIAIIFSSNSVFTLLFAVLFSKEKITRNKLLALVFCITGLLFCVSLKKGAEIFSVLLSLFASLSFSLYTALSQKFMTRLGSAVQTCFVFILGSAVLLGVLICTGADIIPTFQAESISILVYLGLFVTGVGYYAYFKAIEKGGAIMGSLAFFIKPVLTPIVSYFANDAQMGWNVFVAVIFVTVGSLFAILERQKANKK